MRIKNEGLQGGKATPGGRRNIPHHRLQNLNNTNPLFGRTENGVICGEADDIFDFFAHPLGISGGKIDLVNNWDNSQVIFEGQVDIG